MGAVGRSGTSMTEEKSVCYGNFNWGHLGLAAVCGFFSGLVLAIIFIF